MRLKIKKTLIVVSMISSIAAIGRPVAVIYLQDPTLHETEQNIGCDISLSLTRAELEAKIDANENVENVNVSCIKDFSFLFSKNRPNAPSDISDFSQDISKWDVSSGEYFQEMFFGINNFSQDLSAWHMNNANQMDRMFGEANILSTAKINGWEFADTPYLNMIFRDSTISGEINNWTINKYNSKGDSGNQYIFYEATLLPSSKINNWTITGEDNLTELDGFFFDTDLSGQVMNWHISDFNVMSYAFNYSRFTKDAVTDGWVIKSNNPTTAKINYIFNSATANGSINNWQLLDFADANYIFNSSTMLADAKLNNWIIDANNTDSSIGYLFNMAPLHGELNGWTVEDYAYLYFVFNTTSFEDGMLVNNWTFNSHNPSSSIEYIINSMHNSNAYLSNWNIKGFSHLSYLLNATSSSTFTMHDWVVDSENTEAVVEYLFNSHAVHSVNNFTLLNYKELTTPFSFTEIPTTGSIDGMLFQSNNTNAIVKNFFEDVDISGTLNNLTIDGYSNMTGFIKASNFYNSATTNNWLMDSKNIAPTLTNVVLDSIINSDSSTWVWVPSGNDFDNDGIDDVVDLDIDNDGALNAIEDREGTDSFNASDYPNVYYHALVDNTVTLTPEILIYLDSGGINGNYEKEVQSTTTFLPATIGNAVKLDMIDMQTAYSHDNIYIYNGSDTTAPLLATCNYDNCIGDSFTGTSSSGALTVTFDATQPRSYEGWEAKVSEITIPQTDTDGDGTIDFYDLDDDNDGFSDEFELAEGTDPFDASDYPMLALHPKTGSINYPAKNGFKYYDDGGANSDYSTSINNTTVTFTPSSGNVASVTFNSYLTESGYDFLRVYSGDGTIKKLLETCEGTNCNGMTFESTAANGALTFEFKSDGSVTGAGWDATIGSRAIP